MLHCSELQWRRWWWRWWWRWWRTRTLIWGKISWSLPPTPTLLYHYFSSMPFFSFFKATFLVFIQNFTFTLSHFFSSIFNPSHAFCLWFVQFYNEVWIWPGQFLIAKKKKLGWLFEKCTGMIAWALLPIPPPHSSPLPHSQAVLWLDHPCNVKSVLSTPPHKCSLFLPVPAVSFSRV